MLQVNFLNNLPISNPKPPLESSEPQLLLNGIRLNLAIAPRTCIRQIMVYKCAYQILSVYYLICKINENDVALVQDISDGILNVCIPTSRSPYIGMSLLDLTIN